MAKQWASRKAIAIMAMLALLATTLGGSLPADAQQSCQPGGPVRPVYQVSTAAEFNAAIICHNQSTAPQTGILMLNDIAADTVAVDSVFERITRATVFVQGHPDPDVMDPLPTGFRLSRGPLAGTEPLPLLAGTPDARIDAGLLHLELGPYDTFGIQSGLAVLSLGAITSDAPHPDAVGVSATDAFFMDRSIISDVVVGIERVGPGSAVEDSSGGVFGSTVVSTSVDVRYAGQYYGVIDNSTLGGPVGIVFEQGAVEVRYSTILGDAAVAGPGADENSRVGFISSIANTCSAREAVEIGNADPAQGPLGGNAGACFEGSDFVMTSPLADNGCSAQFSITPIGCAPTAAIDATSSAYRAGSPCDVNNNFDQRLIERGDLCDAGAYESRAGDVTYDVVVDHADVQALLEWLAGGPEPTPPTSDALQPTVLQVSDVTADGAVKLDDALALAQLLAG